MFKFLSGVIGLIGATFLFWVGIAYEHRPAGWPNIAMNWGIIHFTFHLPDGPYAQLAVLKAANAAALAQAKAVAAKDAQTTIQVAKQDDTAQAAIRVVTKTIIKEVPTYVTAATDRSFPLSVGFVRVLDAGAAGSLPGPPGESDDSAIPGASCVVSSNHVVD